MKKIIILLLLIISSLSLTETNQQIIDRGNQSQKDVFDKYFKNTTERYRKNNEVLKSAYSELLYGQLDRNKIINEREMKKLKGNRKSEFRKMYENYNLYSSIQAETARGLLNGFLEEKGDVQSYMFVNTYNLFESFELNMNTFLEGERDKSTIDPNMQTIIDYFYFAGDEKTKEDYMKMSNEEMRLVVKKEFVELNRKLDERIYAGTEREKKEGKTVKSNLSKLEKVYDNYDRSFEKYIDSSNLSMADKDSIKKTVKYENIANLRFFKQSLEVIEEAIKEGESGGEK